MKANVTCSNKEQYYFIIFCNTYNTSLFMLNWLINESSFSHGSLPGRGCVWVRPLHNVQEEETLKQWWRQYCVDKPNWTTLESSSSSWGNSLLCLSCWEFLTCMAVGVCQIVFCVSFKMVWLFFLNLLI